jgi:hypothetical protein
MHFVFLKQKKPDDPIVAFNTVANHIGDWCVILASYPIFQRLIS